MFKIGAIILWPRTLIAQRWAICSDKHPLFSISSPLLNPHACPYYRSPPCLPNTCSSSSHPHMFIQYAPAILPFPLTTFSTSCIQTVCISSTILWLIFTYLQSVAQKMNPLTSTINSCVVLLQLLLTCYKPGVLVSCDVTPLLVLTGRAGQASSAPCSAHRRGWHTRNGRSAGQEGWEVERWTQELPLLHEPHSLRPWW
jgi:hypothetical protein